MKVSELIAEFLKHKNISGVFGVTGGASLHLLAAFEKFKFNVIYSHHEQASAFAADATWRLSKSVGVAVATSGPGAMNLIPGIASSFFDSVPTLFLTGQVATFRSSENMKVRQFGFQETDIVTMVSPIIKYAKKVVKFDEILTELEIAIETALDGRMGPVLLDIPDDLQRRHLSVSEISLCRDNLKKYQNRNKTVKSQLNKFNQIFEMLNDSNKPLLLVGYGADGYTDEILDFCVRIGIPIIPTWAVVDRFPSNNENVVGTAGTHGNRYTNYILQKSDLIISLGCRLDSHFIGSPPGNFAPLAKKIIIDIDSGELTKFKQQDLDTDVLIECSVVDFMKYLVDNESRIDVGKVQKNTQVWKSFIGEVTSELNDATRSLSNDLTNPYMFVRSLSKLTPPNTIMFSDTGCILAWSMQGMEFSGNTRFIHAFNNTPMGYSIPAAVSAGSLSGKQEIVCLVGDGSFMMNIQELATLRKNTEKAKIFLINNQGYSMIKQTQEQWFDSNYFGSGVSDLMFPEYENLAKSFDYKYMKITCDADINQRVEDVFKANTHVLCEVQISPDFRVIPQLKYGSTLENMDPAVSVSMREKYGL
ncbi:thiamine pyrophosphate-binding protein [Planktomarina temperata]|nr:thiamine pyrophosphate-binding protein [Planktomarina temperata]